MTPAKKLGTGIHISAEQTIPILLLVLASFLKTSALVLFDTGTSVLFLETFSGSHIPEMIICTAVLVFLLCLLMFYFKEKSTKVPVYALISAGTVSLLLYAFAAKMVSDFSVFLLMTWKDCFRLVAEASFWVVAFRFGIFKNNPKTFIAVIVSQAFTVFFAAGFIHMAAEAGDALSLILWSCFFIFSTALVIDVLISNGNAPISQHFTFTKKKIQRSGKDSNQKKLQLYFYMLSGMLFFAAAFFDYYFLTSSAQTIGEDAPLLIDMFSNVYGIMAAVLTICIFLALYSKISVFNLLYFIPIGMVMAAGGGYFGLFGLIVTAKAFVNLVTLQTKESVLQAMPQAISARMYFRANMIRKLFIEPSFLLLAGLMLFWLERSSIQVNYAYVLSGVAILTLVLITLLRQTYIRMILASLRSYLWRGGRLLITGRRMHKYLKNALQNPNPDEAIYALRILEDSMHPAFPDELHKALKHPNEKVRLFALEKVETLHFCSAADEVVQCAEKDESPILRCTALRVMCRLGDAETREKAVDFISTPDIQEGALVGLLAVGREGVFVAIDKVSALANSFDPEDRIVAARVLGDARNPAFYHPLINLLHDENIEVCREALVASGKLLNPRLLPSVMYSFRSPSLREDAVTTLLQYKETAFPEIKKALNSADNPVQFRILLAKTLGRIKTPAAEEFLFEHISIPDRRVRFNILKSLVLLKYKAVGKHINTVRLGLYDEIEWATSLLAALEKFEQNKDENIKAHLNNLIRAINNEIEYAKERILLLLAILHPSRIITRLMNNYGLSTEEERRESARIVDKILSGELRTLCLPLFQEISTAQKLMKLRPHFYPPMLSLLGYVHDILKSPQGEATDWTRASAVYILGCIGDKTSVDLLVGLLRDNDPIIRETSVWALGWLLPTPEAARLVAPNLDDPSAPVARMARFIVDGTGKSPF